MIIVKSITIFDDFFHDESAFLSAWHAQKMCAVTILGTVLKRMYGKQLPTLEETFRDFFFLLILRKLLIHQSGFFSKPHQHFGFGPPLLNWIELFYCNIESCILNNGWASNFFKLSRGVRQGCPLSPYLFILSAEILADAIRKKQRIKGIEINGIDFKLSQYADDTTLILDGSEESFLESVILIETFGNISGLRLYIKKTEALWIGSKKECDLQLLPEKDFK